MKKIMNDIEGSKRKAAAMLAEAFIKNFEEHSMNCFFSAFQEHFKDRSDFDACLDNLNAEKDKITRLGFFYYVVTKEIGHAGITLISIFSIMEAIAHEKFQPFDQWLLAKIKGAENISFPIADRHDFKKLILSFQIEYYTKHGSSEKVRNFINNYFSIEDKQKLIGGFQIKAEGLHFDSLNFEEQVKAIVDMLYKERNAFIHQGRLPQISDQKVHMLGNCKIKNIDTPVSIQISINEIKKMFERAFHGCPVNC
jgi:hypothetical protein